MHIFASFASRRTGLLLALVALGFSAQLGACRHQGSTPVLAAVLKPIQLPKPEITAGMPLMQALSQRRTTRAFREQPLAPQTLSNLLWAAFGINRPREVKAGLGRTAPSAHNSQDIELDVVLASGSTSTRPKPICCGQWRRAICAEGSTHPPPMPP